MKKRPDLDKLIEEIQAMIDGNQRSLIRYIHIGTLMDILYFLDLYLLKEKAADPVVDVDEYKCGDKLKDQQPNEMIVITTIDALPDHCYECPCHDGECGYCQADKERRYSEYRPFWCPLKEIHNDQERRVKWE